MVRRRASGTITCTPFDPLVLTAPASPASASACRTRSAARDDVREAGALGRVEVEHEVGDVGARRRGHRRVELDRPLAREPQQGAAVVAERVADLAVGRLRPDGHRGDPVGRVGGQVLLHERLLPGPYPQHRQRAVAQLGQDPAATASR